MEKWKKGLWGIVLVSYLPFLGFAISSISWVTPIGQRSFELTRQIVSFGPRPPGSKGIVEVRKWLEKEMKGQGYSVQQQSFFVGTPLGIKEMVNLSYILPGKTHLTKVLLVAHYDSKPFQEFRFVGANDAASSVALLLAISPEVVKRKFSFDVEVVLVDGEEAQVRWTDTDSLYGSRHFVKHLDRKVSLQACLVVDMISDVNLQLIRSAGVDPRLMKILQTVLAKHGWSHILDSEVRWIEDDHLPFIQSGIPTLHLMDFTYGGEFSPGPFWHTPQDTLEHISISSLSMLGEIILGVLEQLPLH